MTENENPFFLASFFLQKQIPLNLFATSFFLYFSLLSSQEGVWPLLCSNLVVRVCPPPPPCVVLSLRIYVR